MKLPKLKKGQVVEVTWEDAWACEKWGNVTDKQTPLICYSVGYFTPNSGNGADGIALTTGIRADDVDAVHGLHFIPRGMVRAVKVLRG